MKVSRAGRQPRVVTRGRRGRSGMAGRSLPGAPSGRRCSWSGTRASRPGGAQSDGSGGLGRGMRGAPGGRAAPLPGRPPAGPGGRSSAPPEGVEGVGRGRAPPPLWRAPRSAAAWGKAVGWAFPTPGQQFFFTGAGSPGALEALGNLFYWGVLRGLGRWKQGGAGAGFRTPRPRSWVAAAGQEGREGRRRLSAACNEQGLMAGGEKAAAGRALPGPTRRPRGERLRRGRGCDIRDALRSLGWVGFNAVRLISLKINFKSLQ